jgi:hypothetical protein
MPSVEVDLRDIGYEDFVAFVFDRPVVPLPPSGSNEPGPWYWNVELRFQHAVVAAHYLRLFGDPVTVLARYNSEQLEQGFWAIHGPNLECSASNLIWASELPFAVRECLVRSMADLFEKFFFSNSLVASVDMWWDSLAYDWYCDNRARANGGEDQLMQDVMFETLQRILRVPSRDVQFAALHGLGHLMHPDTPAVIEAWMDACPGLDDELRDYARDAARFDVL